MIAPASVFDQQPVKWGMAGKDLSADVIKMFRPKQVHGTKIVEASRGVDLVEADGIYSLDPGITIGVVTADCLPVLVYEPEVQLVMAIHAGWRGLTAGILSSCLDLVVRLGGRIANLNVVFGAAISQSNYEVGSEVAEATKNLQLTAEQLAAVTKPKGVSGKYLFDVAGGAASWLNNQGVVNLSRFDDCTFANSSDWFSYRREGKGTGRNITWICRSNG